MPDSDDLLQRPHSPDRPEWALFGRMLARDVSLGQSLGPEAASERMKTLLQEAWATNPNAVIYQVAGNDQIQRETALRKNAKALAAYRSVLHTQLGLGSEGTVFQGEERGISEWEPSAEFLAPYLVKSIDTINARYDAGWITTTTPKKGLLPPNSPDRPEWDMLGKLTRQGNLYIDGLTPEQGAARMKEYLLEAWKERPEEVLFCMANKLLAGRRQEYESAGRHGKFNEYLAFLRDRMWCDAEDGALSAGADPTRGHSGRHIEYWQPQNGGLKAYVYACVTYVNANWEKEQLRLGTQESLDARREIGLEPVKDEHGDTRFVRHEHVDVSEDEPGHEPNRAPRSDDFLTADALAEKAAETRAAVLNLVRTRHDENDLESPFRGEFEFFGRVLGKDIEPAAGPEARVIQLRRLAPEVVDKGCHDMPKEDLESVKEALDGSDPDSLWDPAKASFFKYFPDVTEFLIEKAGTPDLNGAVTLRGDLVRNLVTLNPAPANANLESQPDIFAETKVARTIVRNSEMWSRRGTPEVLLSPGRPDYPFLAQACKEEMLKDLEEGDAETGEFDPRLEAELRRLAMKFVESKRIDGVRPIEAGADMVPIVNEMIAPRDNGPGGAERVNKVLRDATAAWNPMTDGLFGEMILDTLATVGREAQIQVENREAELRRSVLPHPDAAEVMTKARRVRQKKVLDDVSQAMDGQSSLFDAMFSGTPDLGATPEMAPPSPGMTLSEQIAGIGRRFGIDEAAVCKKSISELISSAPRPNEIVQDNSGPDL